MDEDNVAQEVLADLVEESVSTDLSVDQLRQELSKVRREAAAKRVENNALKATQAELQKYKDAEKTELERLQERASRAEQTAGELAREKLARTIAKEAGLDADLGDVLRGNTEEELRASAEVLAAKVNSANANSVDFLAGSRGTPVTATKDSASASFRALFN